MAPLYKSGLHVYNEQIFKFHFVTVNQPAKPQDHLLMLLLVDWLVEVLVALEQEHGRL